jgi:hypothetical protein
LNNAKKNKKKRNKENETCFEIHFGKADDRYCHIKKDEFWEEAKAIAMTKFKHSLSAK